jgi:phospholipase/carboxylesterase
MTTVENLSVRRFGQENGSAPVVVLLHGFGAPGDDLVPLAQVLGAEGHFRFAVPAAPIALAEGGRAWWPIDFASRQEQLARGEGVDLRAEQPKELPQARAHVEALLTQTTQRYKVPRSRIALVGFSQGAMLALDTLLHTSEPVGCVAMLSGSLIAEQDWMPRLAKQRAVPLFMSHGMYDPVLPFRLSEQLRDLLRGQGYRVTWQEFAGGHEIPPQVLRELGDFLQSCLAAG